MAFVIDASVVIASITFERPAGGDVGKGADLLESGGGIVPARFMPEVLNVLVKAERRARGKTAILIHQLRAIGEMGLTTDPYTARHLEFRSLPLARTHRLSIFDATYLELALRRSLPLATFDNGLIRAAQAEHVALLP
jgi:predicted nucleic acid-binding protein